MEQLNLAIDSLLENGMSTIEIIGFLEIIKGQLVTDLLMLDDEDE